MVSQPATKSIRWTTQDIELLPQNEWTTYEIIDGELFVTRSPHRRHQQAAGKIYSALDIWSTQSGLGEAIFAPGLVLSEADNVIPDVVWVSKAKLKLIEDESGHLTRVPELVIEVLSSGSENMRRDREAKLKLYSVQGAQEYWIADRFLKQLEVYRRENTRLALVQTLTVDDTLSSPLLPGFACQVGQFFS
ncbi:Uma2 family endonuclease [cf. Phormidesmis sp. LEGE 11477]|uniref:Uma2 family endonuclease n=1 Tax=cf. Phormidesmis sp. LEGE 11477 TaxID=1828680 RepID=UPI00187E664D|nr:Uma2 family endonuclease [cf. Phormidesmis sp. LEGE 11477]MBE9064014.1 Uma2 family endonuclease [cf. Phormidesmis sp. LEGE 11477]